MNDFVTTSPLERAILTHYYVSPLPYKDGSENWTQCEADAVKRFVEAGLLLQKRAGPEQFIEANHRALAVYMEALASVPLPVETWIVPWPKQPAQGPAQHG